MAPPGKFKKTAVMRKASLTPEEIQLRQVRARRRFKALVWLVIANRAWLEDEDEGQLGDNIVKNVKILTRKKGVKSLLTKQEKSILNKATEDRTEAEKLHLNRVIGGLKCFRRYPAHVKIQLAGVTYFVYYGPGRVIIKQDHPAYALYFILSGEVAVSQDYYDPILNEMVTESIGTLGPGEMFGEVSLLHNIPRTATVITTTPCELLCLKRDDFMIVLKDTVQSEWDKVTAALKRFRYFDKWDEVAQRECCIRSKIKEYKKDETILGDGSGYPSFTYFVLKGQCALIEHIFLKVEKSGGRKFYELLENGVEKPQEDEQNGVEDRVSRISKFSEKKSIAANSEDEDADLAKRPSSDMAAAEMGAEGFSSSSTISLPADVEVHFMQCCLFQETAVFGLGENFKHRRVVAVTPLVVLLIPRYWILQRNIGNVWCKVTQYLNTHIPSTQKLFKEFLAQRKWMAYRKRLVKDIRDRHQLYTGNSVHNVPYSIRLTDDIYFDYLKNT